MLSVHKAVTVHGTPIKVMPKVKLCVNCKHFDKANTSCQKFAHVELVTGAELPMHASFARSEMSLCGTGASYFESVDKKRKEV